MICPRIMIFIVVDEIKQPQTLRIDTNVLNFLLLIRITQARRHGFHVAESSGNHMLHRMPVKMLPMMLPPKWSMTRGEKMYFRPPRSRVAMSKLLCRKSTNGSAPPTTRVMLS